MGFEQPEQGEMQSQDAQQQQQEPQQEQAKDEMVEIPVNESADSSDWNKHTEPASGSVTIAMFVFLALSVSFFALVLAAVITPDDFNRNDKFHPGRVALLTRHFKHWDRQFVNGACIAQTLGNYGPQNDECTYHVPYAAVFGGLSAAFFGLAAVAFYARDVMDHPRGNDKMHQTAETIHKAAVAFLHQEYTYLFPFVVALFIFLYFAIDFSEHDKVPSTAISFLFGAALSAGCGYMGMHIATQGNCRTAAACYSSKTDGLERGLKVAFRSGACMGVGVVSCGVLGLCATYAMFGNTNALGGFGFGSSAVALFARVGGGIYTKAADVGADLCGKVEADLGEDSPKNPATIADCVGDNVGDVAGMGADLFESFVGAVVAAAVLGATEFGERGVALPFYIVTVGLVVSVVCTSFVKVSRDANGNAGLKELLAALRLNVLVAGVVIMVVMIFLTLFLFTEEASQLDDSDFKGRDYGVPFEERNPGPRLLGSIALGLTVGILIGMVTEYFTSHTEQPTQSIGKATEYGPGPVIIQGLGMGMYSTVVPLLLIVAAVLGAYYLAGFYGTAIACVGMLSTLGVTMSTDAYGPVSDNAGGIAEMAELEPWVREYTDSLDALGNTTAATGKGFANGSAVLSALSLLAAFARVADIESVDLLQPVVVIGLLVGSLLPYVFAAMTMLSVNKAAKEMMAEVHRQFKEKPDLLTNPDVYPDYERCIAISCNSSLKEMIMPGVLAVFSPLVMGFIFGSHCLVGVLLGAIASGYLLGVKMSNTGGAWDNAKKWIEAEQFKLAGVVQGKGSDCHKAAVCGDTVGDPFKDTSGPALNILIKLMTRFSFVCAPLFDEAWDLYWVGIILFVVSSVIIAFIQFRVLGVTEPENEVSNEPISEQ